MSERIDKAALAMHPPRRLMVAHLVRTSTGACGDGPRDELVRIIAEDLDPRRRDAEFRWALPAVVSGLAHKECRAANLKTGDGAQAPQLRSAQGTLVPRDSFGSIAH